MLTLIYTNSFIILLENYKLDNAFVTKNLDVLRKYQFRNKTNFATFISIKINLCSLERFSS